MMDRQARTRRSVRTGCLVLMATSMFWSVVVVATGDKVAERPDLAGDIAAFGYFCIATFFVPLGVLIYGRLIDG